MMLRHRVMNVQGLRLHGAATQRRALGSMNKHENKLAESGVLEF
jgi:hypothetical protein